MIFSGFWSSSSTLGLGERRAVEGSGFLTSQEQLPTHGISAPQQPSDPHPRADEEAPGWPQASTWGKKCPECPSSAQPPHYTHLLGHLETALCLEQREGQTHSPVL